MKKETNLLKTTLNTAALFVFATLFSIVLIESLASPDCNRESRDCVMAHLLWSDTQKVFYLAEGN